MKQSLFVSREPSFQNVVIASAVLHIIFIALITVPLKSRDREYKSYFVNLVSPAQLQKETAPAKTAIKPVQKKKLVKPKKTEKKPVVKKQVPKKVKTVPQKKSDVSLTPEKVLSKEREIERLQAISALSKLKKKKEEVIEEAQRDDEALSEAIATLRRRRLVTVSQMTGIPNTVTSSDTESYYALLTEKIWSEWIPLENTKGLEVIISIRINKDGSVISREVEQSSGNTLFDSAAMKAITKASPLPSPPVEMEVGIRFFL